ncbi:heat stress transcription factor B-4b-like [Typha latifolia]|uniref:heat stress transcription factor B-4b-like n=1 Tax=Typha latifolia TaxID=4733 RepID=UPI003C2D5141
MAFLVSMESHRHKPIPAPFLAKTYQLVDDPCTDHIVSWGEEDTTFVVRRPLEFARDLLPSYFKHNNFSSFVRQLNTYGFRKTVADKWEFANEYFRKGAKHLLSEIHRRKASQPFQNYNSPPPPPYHHHHSNEEDFLSALSEENRRLRRRNSLLSSELTQMKKLYHEIIYFLQNHVTPIASEYQGSVTPSTCKLLELGPSPECYKSHEPLMEESDTGTVKLFGVELHGRKG